MSIYLEFPTIAAYPLYNNPFKNDEEIFFPVEDQVVHPKEQSTRQDDLAFAGPL